MNFQPIHRVNYQIALVDSTARTQDVLTLKQVTDSEAGILASDLLSLEYEISTTVLEEDGALIDDAVAEGNANGWTDSDTTNLNVINQQYQNDTATCQVGQSNASTAVQTTENQVGQDGTNLSNALSMSNILTAIGNYMSGILANMYAT